MSGSYPYKGCNQVPSENGTHQAGFPQYKRRTQGNGQGGYVLHGSGEKGYYRFGSLRHDLR